MDQYVVEFKFSMLAIDFIELMLLIDEKGNESLKDYLPQLEDIAKDHEIIS